MDRKLQKQLNKAMLISLSSKQVGGPGQWQARIQSQTVSLCHAQHVASDEGSEMLLLHSRGLRSDPSLLKTLLFYLQHFSQNSVWANLAVGRVEKCNIFSGQLCIQLKFGRSKKAEKSSYRETTIKAEHSKLVIFPVLAFCILTPSRMLFLLHHRFFSHRNVIFN